MVKRCHMVKKLAVLLVSDKLLDFSEKKRNHLRIGMDIISVCCKAVSAFMHFGADLLSKFDISGAGSTLTLHINMSLGAEIVARTCWSLMPHRVDTMVFYRTQIVV